MNRRRFLGAAGAGLLGAALGRYARHLDAQQADARRPNVLWIGVDDLRCGLGCYGAEHIHSPNIDALAARGVTFTNAHVQQAVCAASRASFLTGCRPETTTVDYPYNKYFTDEFLPEHPTLPTYFNSAGYYTRCGGKIHHGHPLDLLKLSGPYMRSGDDPWWQGYALPENRKKAERKRKDKSVRVPAWECADVPDETYKDGALAASCVQAIREAAVRDEPFFLAPGFMKPHLPFNAPKKYWDLYDPDEIDLAPVPEKPMGAPDYALATFELPSYEGRYGTAQNPVTDELARTLRHGYYACTSFIDAQVGKLMAALDELDLWNDTIVVFWSDHGFHLGDQGAWGKHMNYEWSTRAPLIVAAPGVQGGLTSDALVEYVDMFPTVCELAGLNKPDYLEGTSMVPLLREPGREWKSAAFSQYPRGKGLEGYAIRTDRYRYVEWRRKQNGKPVGEPMARELYDHRPDPEESVNVADRPENAERVKELSARLAAGWKAALPT